MLNLKANLLELVRRTSAELPDDVVHILSHSATQEQAGTSGRYAMDVIVKNIEMAKLKSAPLCQDTAASCSL